MEASATAPKTTVATYGDYAAAERAVDFLSDQGFPVERAAIVGTGLKTVEQIAGRLTTGRAALIGAGQGAMIGLLFGLLFGIFFTGPDFLGVVLYGLVAGIIFGADLRRRRPGDAGRPSRLRLGALDAGREVRAPGRPRGLGPGQAAARRPSGPRVATAVV